jgi:hypothetical protein
MAAIVRDVSTGKGIGGVGLQVASSPPIPGLPASAMTSSSSGGVGTINLQFAAPPPGSYTITVSYPGGTVATAALGAVGLSAGAAGPLLAAAALGVLWMWSRRGR